MRILPIAFAAIVVVVAGVLLWMGRDSRSDLLARLEGLESISDSSESPTIRVIVDRDFLEYLWGSPDTDPGMSFMRCGIVKEEPAGAAGVLLTEECVSKGGHIERRRFLGTRVEDGNSYGWMIRPEDNS